MKQSDEGIFLKKIPYSNSSLVVSFFTRQHGLRQFLFKGGKKKSHALFPLALTELSYYGRSDSDLWSLTAVEQSTAIQLQFDPLKSTIAFFMAEIILKCIHQDQQDTSLFDFLSAEIQRLDQLDSVSYFPIEFLIYLTAFLGIEPQQDSEQVKYFNLDEGTFVEYAQQPSRIIDGPEIHLILALINQEPVESFDKSTRERALNALLNYFSIHIPSFGSLKSYEIVKEVLYE